MKLFFTLTLSVISFFSISQTKSINCIETVTIESTYLNEPREFWIGLPNDYDSTKAYPTLFVLDAEYWFNITYALTKEFYHNQDKSPELIVIGIPQVDREHRKMDMTFTASKYNSMNQIDSTLIWDTAHTGGGMNFLNHIEKEVIPYVNSTYSTNGFNTIVGHSLGGYYCTYLLPLQTSFSAFLIFDPSIWYNSGDALTHIKQNLPKDFKTNIYLTSGLKFNGPDIMVRNHLNQIDSLNVLLQTYTNINLGYKSYPNEHHNSMYLYSLMDGLTYLFDGLEYGYIALDAPITLESYKAHYKKVSERLGFTFTAPLNGILYVGYANHYQKNWQNTIDAFEACYSIVKNDIYVNTTLAQCYQQIGNKKKSKYYAKIVKQLKVK